MRAFMLPVGVLAGFVLLSGVATSVDSAAPAAAPSQQCFIRDQISGFARGNGFQGFVRVDADRVFPLQAVGDCQLFQGGDGKWVGRASLISRSRSWFCPGDTADLLPFNHSGTGRCAVTIGRELPRR